MEFIPTLTIEQIQELGDYFYATPYNEIPKTKFFRYGKRKVASGLSVDHIEEGLKKEREEKKARYKQSKIQEIKEVGTEYQNRTGSYPNFFRVSERHWSDGRMINIGLPASQLGKDYEGIITIEERENPEFFKQCLEKYQIEYKAQHEEYKPF